MEEIEFQLGLRRRERDSARYRDRCKLFQMAAAAKQQALGPRVVTLDGRAEWSFFTEAVSY